MIKVAVLDDYQNIFREFIDIDKYKNKFDFKIFTKPFQNEDEALLELENFDAIGRWRSSSEAGTPIDASGILSDGTEVNGPATLREAFVTRGDNFLTTVTEKLLTYAIGRGVESFDGPATRQIVDAAAQEEYRWSALITGIVQSTPFHMRRSAEP